MKTPTVLSSYSASSVDASECEEIEFEEDAEYEEAECEESECEESEVEFEEEIEYEDESEEKSDPNGDICRICRDPVDPTKTVDLLSPCLCRGSLAFIHMECFNQLRDERCGTCKMRYAPGNPENSHRRFQDMADDHFRERMFVNLPNGDLPNAGLPNGDLPNGEQEPVDEQERDRRALLGYLPMVPEEIQNIRIRESVRLMMIESDYLKLNFWRGVSMMMHDAISTGNQQPSIKKQLERLYFQFINFPFHVIMILNICLYFSFFYWMDDRHMNGRGKYVYLLVLSFLGGLTWMNFISFNFGVFLMVSLFVLKSILYDIVVRKYVSKPIVNDFQHARIVMLNLNEEREINREDIDFPDGIHVGARAVIRNEVNPREYQVVLAMHGVAGVGDGRGLIRIGERIQIRPQDFDELFPDGMVIGGRVGGRVQQQPVQYNFDQARVVMRLGGFGSGRFQNIERINIDFPDGIEMGRRAVVRNADNFTDEARAIRDANQLEIVMISYDTSGGPDHIIHIDVHHEQEVVDQAIGMNQPRDFNDGSLRVEIRHNKEVTENSSEDYWLENVPLTEVEFPNGIRMLARVVVRGLNGFIVREINGAYVQISQAEDIGPIEDTSSRTESVSSESELSETVKE